MNIMNKKEK